MNFITDSLNDYCQYHTSPQSELLAKIYRDTHAYNLNPRMVSGHLQGRLLAMLSKMIRPKCILEIGTFTGYSAICLAEGLDEQGKIITIDINEELESRVREYFILTGQVAKFDFRIGNALSIIPTLSGPFDLVWIDADKKNYSHYFDLVIDKIPSGGFMLADNVLWGGKVLEKMKDKDTVAIQQFNEKIRSDERVENIMLPIRDGILLIRKF